MYLVCTVPKYPFFMSDDLLQRYFSNTCSPAEARQVLDWLETDAGRSFVVRRLDGDLLNVDWHAPPNAHLPDAEPMLARLRERMVLPETTETPPTPRWQIWRPFSQPVYRWAAACLAGLALLTGGYGYLINTSETLIQTVYGQIRTVTLPDQSVVTINGNSQVRYGKRSWGNWPFGAAWATGQNREIWLAGEAFFRVTHQKQHEPFVVHLPNKLNVRVLGTEFNVLARPSHMRVVLSSGHIRLGNASGQQLDMKPGELVETTGQNPPVNRRRVNPAVDASWQTDKLTFDDASLTDMVQRLEETYGLTVVVSDPALLNQRFSGTVPNHNVDVLMEGLGQLFGLTIRRQGKQVFINPTE